ncbi:MULTISPECIES: phosphatase PAP2 family protein [Streptomyces]|uniref:Phosphatase PAP2 family protein n=1 Tax=Streptomyces canarius TaxID=285453 RepID=A0ABQ3CLS9_9ACTN|nr:phosphatase PAP2 family protein [Streptomyces canarius]GHA15145.1 phosphatase PAP2 family protein [Streptomyces canarius]
MNRKSIADLASSVGVGAWAAFSVLTLVVIGRSGAPLWLDDSFLTWSVGHRPEAVVALARAVTATGTGLVPYVLAALAGAVAGRTTRSRLPATAVCLACLGLGQLLRYGAMELVHRPRPAQADWRAHASGWAFPSGHTTTAALAAGLLAVALTLRAPRGSTALRIAVCGWGLAVGLTRVYLGVHWFTDVMGGWLFAAGWLGVCLCVAAHLLPAPFLTELTDPAHAPTEDHASEDPGCRGRSRPA